MLHAFLAGIHAGLPNGLMIAAAGAVAVPLSTSIIIPVAVSLISLLGVLATPFLQDRIRRKHRDQYLRREVEEQRRRIKSLEDQLSRKK